MLGGSAPGQLQSILPRAQQSGKVQGGPEVKCASTWPGALVISHATYDLGSQDTCDCISLPSAQKWQLTL